MSLRYLLFKSHIKKLQKHLQELVKSINVVEIKGGTEIEDMDYQEIYFLRILTNNIVPLKIKIGGVEARNDIRFCLQNKVNAILAPMVESEYALKLFVNSMNEIYNDTYLKKAYHPIKCINLETSTGMQNLHKITKQKEFEEISHVTIGRSDLSASLDKPIMSSTVFEKTNTLIQHLKQFNKIISVGGNISLDNIRTLVDKIQPDKWNTRHVVIQNTKQFQGNPQEYITKALSFEMQLYSCMYKFFPAKRNFYKKRLNILEKRGGKLPLQ